jgi:iron complex outermembrane receptor protein
LFYFSTFPAYAAQDVVRQTVVVTAAATPVELASITRMLTVITREQIAELPARSIADILRLIASVDVRARGEHGIQTDFSVRGASFGQVLVLLDGVRLNDAQSGHHNGDIPVPLDAVERIEVLHGPGSSLFGADAFGGTINIITRRDPPSPAGFGEAGPPSPGGASVTPATLTLEGGSFDLVGGRGQVGFERGVIRQTLAASADRSSGFMYERQFKTAGVNSRTSFGEDSGLRVSYLWKDFGANGFYGNAPSHEWTNQTLIAADHRFGTRAGWRVDGLLSYRTHGDHFLFNVQRPSLSENRHRTHAALGSIKASRGVGNSASLTAGVDGGGDWVRSTNLGNRSLARISAFGEWRQALTTRTQLDASLRADRYNEFGSAWSPALGIGWWPTGALRLRGSVGRAFRVPTFTERYYHDPAHLARDETGPESAWTGEGGADVFLASGWVFQATVFGRKDHDVIDWLRATEAERWRTHNVHHVDTRGVELAARKTLAGGAFVQAEYTALDLDAAAITLLSKYILEYAPHTITAVAVVPLPAALRVAPRIEYKHRHRNIVTFDYALLDLRISRRFEKFELRVDGTNLGNLRTVLARDSAGSVRQLPFQEIAGVDMPGRALTVSLAIGRR